MQIVVEYYKRTNGGLIMNKQEIGELLDEIDRFKNNIKECDGVLRTLREIQVNYESAVEQPKEILQKLNTLTARMTVEFDELGEKYMGLLNMSNMQAENLQSATRESIEGLMQETKKSYEALMGMCHTLQQSLEEGRAGFIERANVLLDKADSLCESLQSKQDEVINQIKIMQEVNEKKIDKLSKLAIGGLIGTAISIVLLVVSLII